MIARASSEEWSVAFFRRAIFALSVGATSMLLSGWLVSVLAVDGFGILDTILLLSFFIATSSAAVAMCNAAAGFVLLRDVRHDGGGLAARADHPGYVLDQMATVPDRYAVAMTLRHDDPARAFAHLQIVAKSLRRSAPNDRFDVFVLSDSTDPRAIAAEARAVPALAEELEKINCRLVYRRRPDPVGYKGGNIYDFCERWGKDYAFLILLDADSLMTGDTMASLVRLMQANPRVGVIQTFSVGLPAAGFFARVLQFGLRLVLRSATVGATWWQGECGQYWGHNAIIRIAPFTQHCRLPVLPGGPPFGGHVMCHDQIEAALLSGAGYQVWMLPIETGSFESNPSTLLDFLQRARRWCQGNMQNLQFIARRGLRLQSRVNIFIISLKFLAAAATTIFVVTASMAAAFWPASTAVADGARGLFLAWLLLYLAPRFFGIADVWLAQRRFYGGGPRFIGGAALEIAFSLFTAPIAMIVTTTCILGLLAGKASRWDGQRRDSYGVTWTEALRALWIPSAIGLALLILLVVVRPGALPWFLPFLAGPALSVPFAVVTSSGRLGRWAARRKLCGTPEEFDPPAEVANILPVLGLSELDGYTLNWSNK